MLAPRRLIRVFSRFQSTKIIKTPQMGESITEGTLTEWHKKIGDFVARDEQIATIETDKIDVQVNSPESGILSKQFFNQGDTVTVGGELFEIQLSESSANAPTSQPSSSAKPAQNETKPTQPDAVKQTPQASQTHQKPSRTPLIKFIGPRSKLSPTIAQPTEPKVETKKGAIFIQYDSIYQLPKKYQPIPFTAAEMDAIDTGCADYRMS